MKNVTIALDDETYRLARIRAAGEGTSLSAMVKDYLNQLTDLPISQGVREMPMIHKPQSPSASLVSPKTRQPGDCGEKLAWPKISKLGLMTFWLRSKLGIMTQPLTKRENTFRYPRLVMVVG